MQPENFIDKDGNAVCIQCGQLAPHKKEPYDLKHIHVDCSNCKVYYRVGCGLGAILWINPVNPPDEDKVIPEREMQGIIALRWLRKTRESDIVRPFLGWLTESGFVGREAFSEEFDEILIAYQIHLKELSYITCS